MQLGSCYLRSPCTIILSFGSLCELSGLTAARLASISSLDTTRGRRECGLPPFDPSDAALRGEGGNHILLLPTGVTGGEASMGGAGDRRACMRGLVSRAARDTENPSQKRRYKGVNSFILTLLPLPKMPI
jgi:hypothetical protein